MLSVNRPVGSVRVQQRGLPGVRVHPQALKREDRAGALRQQPPERRRNLSQWVSHMQNCPEDVRRRTKFALSTQRQTQRWRCRALERRLTNLRQERRARRKCGHLCTHTPKMCLSTISTHRTSQDKRLRQTCVSR
jgi:hypothetical protein